MLSLIKFVLKLVFAKKMWYARVRKKKNENKFNINSPPFCRKKSSEAELCTCSPLVDTPPKRSAKIGDMDFDPTKKMLVVAIDEHKASHEVKSCEAE